MDFFRVRDAVFSDRGFAFGLSESAPGGLKGTCCMFVPRDKAGRPMGTIQLPGTDINSDITTLIHLTPYRSDARKAAAYVTFATEHIAGAMSGKGEDQDALGAYLFLLIRAEAPHHDGKTAFRLMETLWGAGRLHAEENRAGSLKYLQLPDFRETISEAYASTIAAHAVERAA